MATSDLAMGQVLPFKSRSHFVPEMQLASYYSLDEALGAVAGRVRNLSLTPSDRSALEALTSSVVTLLAHAKGRQLEQAASSLCLAAQDLTASYLSQNAPQRLREELEAAYLELRVEVLTATPVGWPHDRN